MGDLAISTPLAHRPDGQLRDALELDGLRIFETIPQGQVVLRLADDGDDKALGAAQDCLGQHFNALPNRVGGSDPLVIWIRPGGWLIVSRQESGSVLSTRLREALAGHFASISDQTDAQAVIAIEGEQSRRLLSCGCTLDLHPNAFGRGVSARTLLAKLDVLLYVPPDTDGFRLHVERPAADYLWRWLATMAGSVATDADRRHQEEFRGR